MRLSGRRRDRRVDSAPLHSVPLTLSAGSLVSVTSTARGSLLATSGVGVDGALGTSAAYRTPCFSTSSIVVVASLTNCPKALLLIPSADVLSTEITVCGVLMARKLDATESGTMPEMTASPFSPKPNRSPHFSSILFVIDTRTTPATSILAGSAVLLRLCTFKSVCGDGQANATVSAQCIICCRG